MEMRKLRSLLSIVLVLLLLFCNSLNPTSFAKASTTIGYVTTQGLRVRQDSSANSTKLGSLNLNDKVEIVETLNYWYKIRFNGGFAYVSKDYIAFAPINSGNSGSSNGSSNSNGSSSSGNSSNSDVTIGYVTTQGLRVRQDSTANSAKLGSLNLNDKVEIVETLNYWYKIRFNGGFAYVSKDYIAFAPVNSGNSGSSSGSENYTYTSFSVSNTKVKYLGYLSSSAPAYKLNSTKKNRTIPSGKIAIFAIENEHAIIANSSTLLRVPLRYFDSIVDVSNNSSIVAAYTTFFNTGNVNRSKNISLGANAMETTLSPGEKYSFNGIVGPRTKEKGYALADSYVGQETVQDYGGGVCQLSSTLYAAIKLNGNFRVSERAEHSKPVSYLPSGMDATVNYNNVDLKFVNNYSFSVRVEAYVNGGMLTIIISK